MTGMNPQAPQSSSKTSKLNLALAYKGSSCFNG